METALGPFRDVRSIALSPDGLHVAYLVLNAAHKWIVFVDGRAGLPFDGVGKGSLSFSADGAHIAYVAREGDSTVAVVDGHIGPAFASIRQGMLLLSADGSHWAYAAARGARNSWSSTASPAPSTTPSFQTRCG